MDIPLRGQRVKISLRSHFSEISGHAPDRRSFLMFRYAPKGPGLLPERPVEVSPAEA